MLQFGDDTTIHDLARANERLRAEIERQREQIASLQASSGYEASIAQLEIQRLHSQNIKLAAFFDALAQWAIFHWQEPTKIAAYCRDLAAELRGHSP
jgi:hypothetical protein